MFDEEKGLLATGGDQVELARMLTFLMQGDSTMFEKWYQVHATKKTYEDIASAFTQLVTSSSTPYQSAYESIQQYLDKSELNLPEGAVINDQGIVVPQF